MSANSYYEAHITLLSGSLLLEEAVNKLGWKFSSINGDPTLGRGIKCYATKHFKSSLSKEHILVQLFTAAESLTSSGFDVIRKKVELVIYDDRSSTIRFICEGLCPECHTDDLPTTTREGNHVTINVGNKPLAKDFVPSHLAKEYLGKEKEYSKKAEEERNRRCCE